VRALLRRAGGGAGPEPAQIGPFELDRERHEIRLHGRELKLTRTEYRLLECLLQEPGRVLSREQLLDRVWGLGYFGETRTVDVHVRRLRAKMGSDARLIRTVTGVGYAIETERN
jgi:DNA-binding response OmpR family regulator